METADILQALPHLTVRDRLKIAEVAFQLVQQEQHSLTNTQRREQLAIAAMSAIDDYAPGSELTTFTLLDGEDFYDSPATAEQADA
ncbi:MAG: hypothetical protein KME42_10305 [Tildeniella nuda ZEHNDER 1965/U140]|jgi:hypothetical protein|nr:hypothetical protein [Tildeniella nuda ZEHNDER 1965/U140]